MFADECGISSSVWGGKVDSSNWVYEGQGKKPSPDPENADSHCTYLNEFNQCLTCAKGYVMIKNECEKSGPNPDPTPSPRELPEHCL